MRGVFAWPIYGGGQMRDDDDVGIGGGRSNRVDLLLSIKVP